jgi:hypothetical protein
MANEADLRAWTDDVDPATIPDEVLRSERARRNNALRRSKSGGVGGGPPKKMTAANVTAAKKMLRTGSTQGEVAGHFGVSIATIGRRVGGSK